MFFKFIDKIRTLTRRYQSSDNIYTKIASHRTSVALVIMGLGFIKNGIYAIYSLPVAASIMMGCANGILVKSDLARFSLEVIYMFAIDSLYKHTANIEQENLNYRDAQFFVNLAASFAELTYMVVMYRGFSNIYDLGYNQAERFKEMLIESGGDQTFAGPNAEVKLLYANNVKIEILPSIINDRSSNVNLLNSEIPVSGNHSDFNQDCKEITVLYNVRANTTRIDLGREAQVQDGEIILWTAREKERNCLSRVYERFFS